MGRRRTDVDADGPQAQPFGRDLDLVVVVIVSVV
jgi:hypothetical protein